MTGIVRDPFTITPGTVQHGLRRVRAFSAVRLVVDSVAPLLVWAHAHFPQYFFHDGDIEVELLPAGNGPRSKVLGPSELFDAVVDGVVHPKVAQRFPQAPVPAMREAFTLTWSAFDAWLEEDEPVYTHPRSPHVRVDALASSRHIRVVVGGVVVAESARPVVLHETGLEPRYYLPRVDVRMDLLTPTATQTNCPYKGTATYWSLAVQGVEVPDAVWGYATPFPEASKIAGLVSFWYEKDEDIELWVDGQRVGSHRSNP